MYRICTIGHATRSVGELIDLLQRAGVDLLVDIRTMPRSRVNPQFNQDALPEPLAAAQIGYRHMKSLGGLRHHPKSAPPSWRSTGSRNRSGAA